LRATVSVGAVDEGSAAGARVGVWVGGEFEVEEADGHVAAGDLKEEEDAEG